MHRRRCMRYVKSLAAMAVIIFAATQIVGFVSVPSTPSRVADEPGGEAKPSKDTESVNATATKVKVETNKIEDVSSSDKPMDSLIGQRVHGLPNKSAAGPDVLKKFDSGIDVQAVLEAMEVINRQQFVRNEEVFGPVDNETIVIAVQVHNRLEYLRQLIVSLSVARDIDRTLIIFSHDYWDRDINDLVASVDFAKCMQIFYPFSIQTHPGQFPGESENDCPRDTKKDDAKGLNCTNRDWPDLYGHYREAKFTQTKHHWWWKANRIFDQLHVTQHHMGLVLFLEEDHQVAEDFLHVLKMVDAKRLANYPDCDIICLGTYLKSLNFPRNHNQQLAKKGHHAEFGGGFGFFGLQPMALPWNSRIAGFDDVGFGHLRKRRLLWAPPILSSVIDAFSQVSVTPWYSAKHNMGMAFSRHLWRRIRSCSSTFCSFDDYNWDWSLHHVSITCLANSLKVLLVRAPRVFHIGECGVHHKKKECNSATAVKKVRDILQQAQKYLFPQQLVVTPLPSPKKKKIPKGNGGWGDKRDHQLCQNMALAIDDDSDVQGLLRDAQKILD